MDLDRFLLGAALVVALAAMPTRGLAAPTPTVTTTPVAVGAEGRLRRIYVRPTWDDGIVYRIGIVHERTEPNVIPRLFPTRTLVSGRVGARLHLDGAAFATAGHVARPDDDVDIRRAFVNLGGDIALRWPVRYYFEFGVLKEKAYLDRGWFDLRRPGSDLVLAIGQYYAPLGLEQLTSSNTITFLERAQPVQAFAPGTKAGVQLSLAGDDRDVAWAFGGFTDTQRADAADGTDGPTRLVGRIVWVPRALADPTRQRLIHLGVAGEYVLSTSASVRYKATPESSLAPPLVDTGRVDASHAGVHGLELAVQQGPFMLQSEYLGAVVAPSHDSPTLFFGGYVALSALLTGEVRPYDRRRGAFGMPVPTIPFSFRDRRWRGAWEVGMRYSYLDLDAGGVTGGRDHALSFGVNWYWNRHVRLMADYGLTAVIGDKPNGTLHVFQTRLQLVY